MRRVQRSVPSARCRRPADAATGRARQILPDDHFLMTGDTLGQAYRRCADVSRLARSQSLPLPWSALPGLASPAAPGLPAVPAAPAAGHVRVRSSCAAHAAPLQAGRGRNEKRKPYKHLRTPWGESFRFSPEARQRIPHEVLARIHQLNPLDEELWKAGNDILEVGRGGAGPREARTGRPAGRGQLPSCARAEVPGSWLPAHARAVLPWLPPPGSHRKHTPAPLNAQRKLEEQREKGVLQAVPRGRYPPPAHSGYASKRRLNSNQEFVTNKYDWQASSFGKPAGGGDVLYSHLAPPPAKDHAAAAQPAGNEAGGHGVPVAAGGSGTQEWAATGQAAEQPAGADQATVENSEQQAADEQQAAEQQAAAEPSAPARVSSQGFAEQAAEQRAVPREVASLAGEQHGGLGAAAGAAALASAPSREEL